MELIARATAVFFFVWLSPRVMATPAAEANSSTAMTAAITGTSRW